MWNGIDYVGFFITFGGGFILGIFFGIAIIIMMDKEDRNDK